MWCHGSAGNGRFLLHAARLDAFPGALDLACRAAQATYRRALGASPVQCHGLSGNIEVLLDMFQATGDGSYLNDAHRMARLLRAFERERDGNLMWSSESPAVFTPDYLIGYGGVAVCLARLSQPERVPHLLSRAGFQYRQHLSGAEFIPPAERSGVHDQPVPAA